MYCIKCGKENADDAAFCQKCGNAFEAEEETRVAARPVENEGGERQIFSISPTLMFVKIGYALAVVGAFVLGSILAFLLPVGWWFLGIPAGLLLLLVPVYYHVRRKLVRYTLTDSKIEIDEGFISRTTRSVPLRRIQDVTVSATVMQRMLGFGNVVIDNSGNDGERIVFENVNSPRDYADILLKQMRLLEK